MEKQILGQEPAFPIEEKDGLGSHWQNHLGMSKRFYAAIKLRVPDSGEEWLDEMIQKANKRDTPNAAMQGLLSSGRMTGHQIDELIGNSYEIADELLKQENQ